MPLSGEAGGEALALRRERRRTLGLELGEQRVVRRKLALPLRAIDAHDLVEARAVERGVRPVDVMVIGHEADGALACVRTPGAALDDPSQHPHVLAEAGPGELAA